jgi:hypothetical protein
MAFNTRLLDAAIVKCRQQNEQIRQETLTKLLQWFDQNSNQYRESIESTFLVP